MEIANEPPSNPGGGAPRKWLVMAAVASGVFLGTIDGSIVNIALPVLTKKLNTDFATIQWVVLAYLLASTALMPAAGRLADMFGKKFLYIAGFVVFTIGSGLCGISWSVSWLIAFRILQSIGGALLMALGAAIVTETFPARERGRALGIVGSMVSIGLISGPTAGGIILGNFSWHWIFLVNLPIGIVGIILSVIHIPDLKPAKGQRFDFPGAASLFAALLCLLLGLTLGQKNGFLEPASLALYGVFAAATIVFVIQETQTAHPIIAPEIFGSRLLRINLVTGYMTFFCAQGTVLLMPFFLMNVMKFDPSKAGMLMATVPLAMGITSPLSGALSDRIGTRPLTALGLFVMLGGYMAVNFIQAETPAFVYVLMFLPIGVGAGLFQSPNNSAIMGGVPRNRLGVASSLLSLNRVMGVTTGVAILGAFWAHSVNSIAGAGPGSDATTAPVFSQVGGIHRTLTVSASLIFVAFLLSLWAIWAERGESPGRGSTGQPGVSSG